MRLIRGKIGIFMLILCLGLILAAVWYGIFGLLDKSKEMDGTLVKHSSSIKEEMIRT